MNMLEYSVQEIANRVKSGAMSAVAVAEAYLSVIREKDGNINAFIEVFDDVLEQARVIDKKIKEGLPVGTLAGVPIAIKDNILMEGRSITAGSKILDGYTATYDAYVIEQLKRNDVVIVGRVNMDEFAMGSSTETSCYGATKNPRDTTRVPGGSSGGSAAAVAMGGVPVALGTDTGGSIRQPAAFCGVVGLKPSYGRVSRRGAVAMASSLDQIGPLGRSVSDVQLIFDVISGHDSKDSTSLRDSECAEEGKEDEKKSYTIGVPDDFVYADGVDKEVIDNFKSVIKVLTDRGHTVKTVSLPYISYSLAAYYILMPAEASANLARYDGVRYGRHVDGDGGLLQDYLKSRGEGFGREVRRRIMLGTHVLSSGYYDAYYNRANAVRDLIAGDFRNAFNEVDVLLTPTTPAPAFTIGEKIDDPLAMYMADIFTVPVNLTGVPALSLPSGSVTVGKVSLPLGVQIIAPFCAENRLFSVGKEIEKI